MSLKLRNLLVFTDGRTLADDKRTLNDVRAVVVQVSLGGPSFDCGFVLPRSSLTYDALFAQYSRQLCRER